MEEPVPVFVGLNFHGNHTIHLDLEIKLSKQWINNNQELGIENNCATEQSRGSNSSRWPVEKIVTRGYALATIYCGDMDPDFHDGFQNGVHPLFYQILLLAHINHYGYQTNPLSFQHSGFSH